MKNNIRRRLSRIAEIIKTSLAMMIPILFIGSITVLLNGFPVQVYQDFLDSFLGGALRNIILVVQVTTIGIRFLQGYYYSKPQEASEFARWITG